MASAAFFHCRRLLALMDEWSLLQINFCRNVGQFDKIFLKPRSNGTFRGDAACFLSEQA
jgi:hypothetical protein